MNKLTSLLPANQGYVIALIPLDKTAEFPECLDANDLIERIACRVVELMMGVRK